VVADEIGLRSCRRIEGRQRKAADILYNPVRIFRVTAAKGVPNPDHELGLRSP